MQLRREEQTSDPALQSIQGIGGIGVEADLGVRGVLMNDVDKLLEKKEVSRDGSDTCTNQNTVEWLLLKFCGDNRLCCLAKVNQTMHCVIAKSL